MNLLVKKNILISFLFLALFFSGANFCFAAEDLELQLGNDYLVTTDSNVKSSVVSDLQVITLNPFFTIFNEKNVLLLHPLKAGKSSFTVFLDTSNVVFNVLVKSNNPKANARVIHKDVFDIMLLDAPPHFEDIDLDAPPKGILRRAK